MHLYLSHQEPWNATYTTAEGQVIYKVKTPLRLGTWTATIQRVIPNTELLDSPVGTPSAVEPNFQDRFGQLGQIEFHNIQSSRIRYQGQDVEASVFFRKSGFGWYGRHRIFTAPDGKEYKWKLGMKAPELVMNDGSKTPIARCHRKKFGILSKAACPASLEIFPAGKHIADVIVVTFVYIEKLRKDREQASVVASSGA
ncbi:hypothetical protein BDQ12DRAFT_763694 [Crucibulum laeve]|uniref:DUF6593 domain-containing protein n=1 Tax=Crucibulum laeve TaxID=68775 RepID=A0A5C3LNU6_9AGAR|nr:hypothetical protein BDQ12DRAFT_763694 [Crucibulum laeve]